VSDVRDRLQVSLGSAYLVERELGGGGMSRTYVATERALSRRVVVKVLAPELLAGISVERFKREVLLAAQLQHPHIVPVLTTGDADGLPWFTMPYVEGESLRMRLARGPLPMGEITGILRDVARALDFAHAHHVVHRDIKPDNVLLAGTSATVTDFGIAKAITAARTDGGGTETGLTMTGQAIGTPAYMAPEQAAGDHHADPRSDIYSYGVLAYELLAGRPPFVASSAIKVIGAHLTETPRPIQELRADVPPALRDLVMRCLEKDVANRPQSATDLVRVLDAMASSATSDIAPRILLGGHIRLGRALSLWSIATLLVAVTAWAATNVIGLPDWVLPGSLGVMLAGLPMIALTWYVQRTVHRAFTATPAVTPGGSESGHGTFATLAIKASPHFSWRRTSLGGARRSADWP
jgi:eukaryotic-like serine/threonine-protein kinase